MSKTTEVKFGQDKVTRILYHVTFTWCDSYRPTEEVIRNVSLVVEASDKFAALSTAWDRVKFLNDGQEPKDMSVKRQEVCD